MINKSERKYEMVLLISPVFSNDQVKDFLKGYEDFFSTNGVEITFQKSWGLRNMAYSIKKKNTAHYHCMEFSDLGTSTNFINALKTQLRIDQEVILRHLILKAGK